MNHVEFVSYTGEYPNLCRGILTLKIDGELVKFGYSFITKDKDKNCYTDFWRSGGACGFYDNFRESYVDSGEWIIEEDELPEKFRTYTKEIAEVFNDNVPYGCCGGCL